MKKINFKNLELSKTIISKLFGGVTDPDDDDYDMDRKNTPKPAEPHQPNDHTRSCPSWNVSC